MNQRPIKFRVWDGKKISLFPMFGYNENVDINEQFKCANANGLILMQFTGLTDRNGVEIFEGDIVKEDFYENSEDISITSGIKIRMIKKIGIMEWDKMGFQIKSIDKNKIREWQDEMGNLWSEKNLEVIGNVMENSEYLTPKI